MTSKLQVGDLVWWNHPRALPRRDAVGIIISVVDPTPTGFGSWQFLEVFWFDEQEARRHSSRYLAGLGPLDSLMTK